MGDEPVYLDACSDFFGDPRNGIVEDHDFEKPGQNEEDKKGVFARFAMTRHGECSPRRDT